MQGLGKPGRLERLLMFQLAGAEGIDAAFYERFPNTSGFLIYLRFKAKLPSERGHGNKVVPSKIAVLPLLWQLGNQPSCSAMSCSILSRSMIRSMCAKCQTQETAREEPRACILSSAYAGVFGLWLRVRYNWRRRSKWKNDMETG